MEEETHAYRRMTDMRHINRFQIFSFHFSRLIAVASPNRTLNSLKTIIELLQQDVIIKDAHSSIKRCVHVTGHAMHTVRNREKINRKLNDKNHSYRNIEFIRRYLYSFMTILSFYQRIYNYLFAELLLIYDLCA